MKEDCPKRWRVIGHDVRSCLPGSIVIVLDVEEQRRTFSRLSCVVGRVEWCVNEHTFRMVGGFCEASVGVGGC